MTDRRLRFQAMGSACEICLAGPAQALASAEPALRAAQDEVLRIEAKYSRYRPDTVVSRLNAAAGTGTVVPVDDETRGLLDFALQLHALSDGRFDITSGVLRRAWDFRSQRLPEPQQLADLLPLIDARRIQLDAHGACLPIAGMELDFGGLGKEYAADRAATVLIAAGWQHGWVNLGGDIRLLGPQADGTPWQLGIAHPRLPDALIGELALSHGALATSGDYERYLIVDGQRYSHILDPRTGWPVRHWQSVSVVAPACLAAGALATLAMLMGPDAPGFLAAQGVPHVLVDPGGQVISVAD